MSWGALILRFQHNVEKKSWRINSDETSSFVQDSWIHLPSLEPDIHFNITSEFFSSYRLPISNRLPHKYYVYMFCLSYAIQTYFPSLALDDLYKLLYSSLWNIPKMLHYFTLLRSIICLDTSLTFMLFHQSNRRYERRRYCCIHVSVVGWSTMLQAGRSRVRVPMRWIFQLTWYFQPHYGLGSTQPLPYQESSWRVNGWQPHRRLWVDCLEKMWEPRRLTTLWTITACYRDSFTFYLHIDNRMVICVAASPKEDYGSKRTLCQWWWW
jgi:hypothetical protein